MDEDGFVGGVGAFADRAEAVEGGNAECGGEVAVRGAAGGGLVEPEAEFGGETAGLLVERDGPGLALHRGTVDAAGNLQLAVRIGTAQAAEEPVDAGGIAGASDAHIDIGEGVLGDDVGARASRDDAGIDGEAATQIGSLRGLHGARVLGSLSGRG